MFNPRTEYDITSKPISIRDFHEYADEFVVRPPYQRKTVWSTKKQQALMDSLFRRYYIPRIVIRQVRLDETRTVNEVIDGQQRIYTVQRFFSDGLVLPTSLADVHPDLPGTKYSELSSDIRRFIDKELQYDADIVKSIDNPRNADHQHVATEIFWRLQQGESLNYMEIAHSRISSLARNFVVKYADDIGFDYAAYQSVDKNPHKHPFFSIIDRGNNRMQHLALLTRFLILEESDGPTELKDSVVLGYTDRYMRRDGIDNLSLEEEPFTKRVLSNLRALYQAFKNDPMVEENGGMKELKVEYFIVSIYLLLRHLRKYYVYDEVERHIFHDFVLAFHARWRGKHENDNDALVFADNRQQDATSIETRDRVIRQCFFEYCSAKNHEMLTKDQRRAFSEAERIAIYRRGNGLCQMCLNEGKSEREARVPWSEFQADHVIPHAKGGETSLENAQLLCRYHNQQKSDHV